MSGKYSPSWQQLDTWLAPVCVAVDLPRGQSWHVDTAAAPGVVLYWPEEQSVHAAANPAVALNFGAATHAATLVPSPK